MESSNTGSSSQLTVLTALAAVFPFLGSLILREGVVPWEEIHQPPEDMTRFLGKLRPLTSVAHRQYSLQPWVDVLLHVAVVVVSIGILYGLLVWCHFGTRQMRKKISSFMTVAVPVVTVGLFLFTADLFRSANVMLEKPGFYVFQLLMSRRAHLNAEDPKILSVWDKSQISLKCCGFGDYTDWRGDKPHLVAVPDSCCRVHKPGCGKNFTLESIYRTGCDEKLSKYIDHQYFIQTQNQQNAYQNVSIVFLHGRS